MKRRVLAICMAAALCVGLLPTTILAETGETAEDAEESTEETEVQAADIEIGEDGTATIVLDDAEEEEKEEKVVEPEQPAEEEPEEDAEDEAEPEEVVYTAKSDSISVEVTAPYGALPDDAELKVERFAKGSKEYKDAAEAIGHDADDANMAALDISFESDGEEVEPSEAVKVSIDASGILPYGADASTLEVQHLEEGRAGQVRAEVVANESNETEGTINAKKATAEFEVDSFSTFTIEWNDGTGTSITVHVYNINGTSIDEELDEESYLIADNGTITISEIVNHLEQNASYTSTYTFAYATIYYETTNNQGGFDPGTVGDEDNSVTQITKSGTNYTINYGTNSSTTLNDPYVVTIHLYYSLPTVTITATENTDGTVGLSTENSYFTGDTSDAEYHWALSDDAYGSITPGENGTATFTWSEDAEPGDQVSVTVTMTVGDETASDTYTLTYGTESTTIRVTVNRTAQANANVALVDEDGNTVATGKTGDDGTITFNVAPGTYTVGVTYVTYNSMGGGSTTRYTNSGTVTVAEGGTITGDTTVNLTTSVSSGPGGDTNGSGSGTWSSDDEYYYEHIDVKVAVAEGAEEDAVFSDLDRVYVYDEYGNLIYYSLDLVENDDTTDYNGLFDVNGSEGHSLVISSKDTIILVFEVYEDGEYKTYTETITPSTTYPEGEYYSYSDVNAYQLYNSIYGTNISSGDWETALNNGTLQTLLGDNYNENGIAIGGLTFIQVADYLCDTRTQGGQAGLDFVIDVGLISVLYEDYNLQIAKSLEDVPDSVTSVEEFAFTLQELSSVSDSTDYTEAIWDTINNALGDPASANTGELTKEADGTWSAIADFGDFLEYEAEEGTTLFYYVLSEKDATTATAEVQYYGIKVSVEYSSATGIATVTASYCKLVETDDEGVYNRNSGWTSLTAYTGEDEDGEYTYYSIPFVNVYNTTGFDLTKVDVSGNLLSGAVFTMSTSDGTTLYFTSSTEEGVTVYTLTSSTTEGASEEIAVTNGGPVSIQGIAAGTYTLSETAPDGYIAVADFTVTIDAEGNVSVSGTNVSVAENSDTVTVTDLEATSITVTKTWLDNNNAYTTRPESITVTITGSDGNTYTLTLNDDNSWTATQDNLPKTDSNGGDITYTVAEETVNGYTGTIVNNNDGTYSITNTLTGTTEAEVEKVWVDNNNAYNTRPNVINVQLLANGNVYGESVTLNEANTWSYSWDELPKYDSTGTEIVYTVQEITSIDDYETTYSDDTFTITNTLTGETEAEVTKVWEDNEDQYNNRPASISVQLLANDEAYGETVTLTGEDNSWTYKWEGLPKYDSTGTEIVYTVQEIDTIDGYDTTYSDDTFTITNTLQTTDISVIKVWNDDGNRDGIEPEDVKVQLKANGENVGDSVTLTKEDSWSATWKDLPVYVNGSEVTYTVEEVEVPDGYTMSGGTAIPETDDDGNATGNYIAYVVNTHEDALTQITVNKEWQDADNENGTRPDEVTVQLMANGVASGDAVTLDESNGWSYTWEGLYSFEDGELIEYTVEETAVDGYSTEIGDLTPVYDGDNNLTGYTITVTNTRTGETEIGVEKTWADDSDNKYETRPDDITVTITGSDGNSYELTLSDDNDWSDTLSNLPMYDSEGAEITYEVTEETVNGYTGTVVDNEDGTYTITNTLETVEVSGKKTWTNDSESDRPDSITVYVYADDSDTAIATVEVTADDDWTWTVTDLPKYNADGNEIVYTVKEGEVDGYIPTYDGTDIENALPEVHKYVSDPDFGESTDDDLKEDEAGNHNTLEYKLEADHIGGAHNLVLHDLLDEQLDIDSLLIKSVILYEYEGDSGRTLEEGTDYTVTQGVCTADCGLDDCTFEIHVIDEDVQDLTSDAYIIVIYDIDVNEDVEDFDESFVDEIINFVGLSFFATFAEIDEADTYSYGFGIYKYASDTEDPLEGAEFILSTEDEDGTTVYAQFDGPYEDNAYLLTGWTDSKDDATAIITDSDGNAIVEGLHDGTFILTETETPEGYTYTMQDTEIVISAEDDYSDPTVTVDGETADDETAWIANAPDDEEQIPNKAVDINDDDAFFDGDKEVNVGDTLTYEIRYYNYYSEEVTVTITDCLDEALDFVEASDGGVYDEDSRTITWTIDNAAANSWGSVTFKVTVNETALEENEIENTASVKIDGSDAVDTNEVDNPVPETRDISGSKTWDDDNDKADARPASITVNLYQNGDPYDSKTVTAADGWAWSWNDLPRYDENNEAYAYTIDEDTVEYYTPTYYEGNFNITNTFIGEEGAEQPPTSGGPEKGGDQPKTGDTSNLGVWLALLIAALACALVGFRMRKRS